MNILNDVLGGGNTPEVQVHVDVPDKSLVKLVAGIILAGVAIVAVWWMAKRFS